MPWVLRRERQARESELALPRAHSQERDAAPNQPGPAVGNGPSAVTARPPSWGKANTAEQVPAVPAVPPPARPLPARSYDWTRRGGHPRLAGGTDADTLVPHPGPRGSEGARPTLGSQPRLRCWGQKPHGLCCEAAGMWRGTGQAGAPGVLRASAGRGGAVCIGARPGGTATVPCEGRANATPRVRRPGWPPAPDERRLPPRAPHLPRSSPRPRTRANSFSLQLGLS